MNEVSVELFIYACLLACVVLIPILIMLLYLFIIFIIQPLFWIIRKFFTPKHYFSSDDFPL